MVIDKQIAVLPVVDFIVVAAMLVNLKELLIERQINDSDTIEMLDYITNHIVVITKNSESITLH